MFEIAITGFIGLLIVWLGVKFTPFGNYLSVLGNNRNSGQKKLLSLGFTVLFVSIIMCVGVFSTII